MQCQVLESRGEKMAEVIIDDEIYRERSIEDLLKREVFYHLGIEKTAETKRRLAETNTTRLYYHLMDGTPKRYYTDVPGCLAFLLTRKERHSSERNVDAYSR